MLPVISGRTTSPPAIIDSIIKNISTSSKSISSSSDRDPLAAINGESASKRQKGDAAAVHHSDITSCSTAKEPTSITPSPPNENEIIHMIVYPTNILLPSRGLVQSLYEEALKGESDCSDQVYLRDAGLLSLEQVLLPAVAYQEEQGLKQLQAVVQRDCPGHKSAVVATRKAVYDSVGAACSAVAASRETTRAAADAAREVEWREQRELMNEQRKRVLETAAQRQAEAIEAAKQQRKRELQKKLPANQELWREVAYLMTELTKLSQEERQWNLASENLMAQEAALARQEAAVHAAQQEAETSVNVTSDEELAPPIEQIIQVADTAEDIALSVQRIRSALQIVSQTVVTSEQARRDLYQQYVTDHQFQGYQGVQDPKGLLKALSQSQADDDDMW